MPLPSDLRVFAGVHAIDTLSPSVSGFEVHPFESDFRTGPEGERRLFTADDGIGEGRVGAPKNGPVWERTSPDSP